MEYNKKVGAGQRKRGCLAAWKKIENKGGRRENGEEEHHTPDFVHRINQSACENAPMISC